MLNNDGYKVQSHSYRYWPINRINRIIRELFQDNSNYSLYYQPE